MMDASNTDEATMDILEDPNYLEMLRGKDQEIAMLEEEIEALKNTIEDQKTENDILRQLLSAEESRSEDLASLILDMKNNVKVMKDCVARTEIEMVESYRQIVHNVYVKIKETIVNHEEDFDFKIKDKAGIESSSDSDSD
jgi:predicted RNase H-like nuclease (RuvC/YqgF family)